MKSNKHIVIITPGFPKDESDDNCIPPLFDYVRHITTKEDTRISVITLQYPASKSNYRWHNVNVYALGGDDVKFPGRFFIWKKVISEFKKINEDNHINVIHSFWLSECALLGNFLSSKHSIKHINTVMGKEANCSNRYLRFINFNKLKLVALSERQKDSIKKKVKVNADKIIPWGLNKHLQPPLEICARRIDLLGVGSLISIKNYSAFINIIYRLKEFKPDIKSMIIGDGVLKEKLGHQIRKLGLDSNITLTGNLPRNKVFKYMMGSKILLHTSTFESFGMVFIEALYYGLHIVSKPVGIAEATDRWQVCSSDDDLLNAIKHILQSSENHEQILLHSLEETADSYLKIYFEQ